MKNKLKILHTADLHLGAKFIGLGTKGIEQRRRLREALQSIVDLACQEQVDLLLLAGDTFDSHTPSPESLRAFKSAITRLSAEKIPVLVIAGTHDGLIEKGVWDQMESEIPGLFFLFKPQQTLWKSEEKNLVVQGVSLLTADSPRRPLENLKRLSGTSWQIGLVHAALEMQEAWPGEAVISSREIADSCFDYLALGHWHNVRDCSVSGHTAWYAGSPEMIALDQKEPGSVLLVHLEAGQLPKVETRRIGKCALLPVTWNVPQEESILPRLRAMSDPDRILELTLQGIIQPEGKPELAEIRRELEGLFFYLRIQDQTTSALSPETLEHYPENTVLGRFIRLVLAEQSGGDAKKQAQWDQVLQLGLALLQGHEVALWS